MCRWSHLRSLLTRKISFWWGPAFSHYSSKTITQVCVPDGLIDEDKLVEIKCPYKCSSASMETLARLLKMMPNPSTGLEQFGYNLTNNERAVNYWCLINEIIIITNCLIQCLHHTLCDSMISSQMCDPNLQGWQQLLPDYHRLWQAETKGGSPLLLSGIEQNLYCHRCQEMSENMGAGTFLLLALFVWASAINVAINNVMCHNPVLHTL